MRLLLPISVSLLLAWQAARAQSADDFFNSGAHFYISNNIPQALESVETGLKQYPDDVKLKKLYELLKQQKQQQSQNNQSQQNQNQQSQQNQSQPSSIAEKPAEPAIIPTKPERPKPSRPKKYRSAKSAATAGINEAPGDQQENQNEQGQPVPAGQMTPEEAKRLLDAQKGGEQFLQLKPQGKPQDNRQPVKDW